MRWSSTRGRAESVEHHGHGLGHSDRVSQLDLDPVSQACCNQILGDIARHVAGGAVHLGRILPGKGSTPVTAHSAVGVDDDLAAGQATVTLRPPGDETSGGVDKDLCLTIHQFHGNYGLNDVAANPGMDVFVGHGIAVLRGNDDRVDSTRREPVVLYRYLGFPIRTQPLQRSLVCGSG